MTNRITDTPTNTEEQSIVIEQNLLQILSDRPDLYQWYVHITLESGGHVDFDWGEGK